MPSPPLVLDGRSLRVEDVVALARDPGRGVAIAPEALAPMTASREIVERAVARGETMYGVNTGFGKLAGVAIAPGQLERLQVNLIRSHAAGVGAPLPAEVVRVMMLLRANVLLRPTSGVRPALAEALVALLNAGILPVVPEQGSVGASGDLAPLSHLALALMGEGDVAVAGRGLAPAAEALSRAAPRPPLSHLALALMGEGDVAVAGRGLAPAAEALSRAALAPFRLAPKEGLAFINGTQAQTALLTLLVHDADVLWRSALGAAAMSLDALRGTPTPLDERIHALRPPPGQRRAAELLRGLLEASEIRESHRDNDPRVQDAYSLRCTPQVLGAVGDALAFARQTAEVELNASTDNPLVLEDGAVVSGGNFDGQPVAQALDFLAIALTTLTALSDGRLERLVNPALSQG